MPVMARAMVDRLAYVASRRTQPSAATVTVIPLALILAHEHGTGLEAPLAVRYPLVTMGEPVQKLRGLRIKPTQGLLLEVPADETPDEVLAEGRRWGRPERCTRHRGTVTAGGSVMAELGCGGGRRETAGDLVGYAALASALS
jgi:hypothetical protein